MFNKLFRKYNQNIRTIWIVIIFVALFFILLQTIFSVIRNMRRTEQEQELNNYYQSQLNSETSNTEISNNEKPVEIPNDVAITSSSESIINQFVKLCNENKLNEAYDIISQDCKEVLYPTINDFKNTYYNKIFNMPRSARVENSMYEGEIYKVTYMTDLLSNGGYSGETTFEDYIYVTREDDEPKISLNKFIYIQDINKTASSNEISINILKKRVFIDYEEYQIQISNNTNNEIYITPDERKIYLLDENDIEYTSNIDEFQTNATLIKPNESKIFDLTFYKGWRFNQKC